MRLLLTGAGGKFGADFIARYGAEIEILALRHSLDGAELPRVFDPHQGTLSPPVRAVTCDFGDTEAIWRTIAMIVELAGPVDHVINAAADVRFLGDSQDAALYAAQARQQMDANLIAPAVIASSLFHHDWKARRPTDASILNVSSISAHQVFAGVGQAFYATSKAALNTFTLHLAEDLKAYGIRVNGLSPDAFPASVPTRTVVEAAMKIVRQTVTGHIFQLGGKGQRP